MDEFGLEPGSSHIRFPFRGIQQDRFYVEGDPRFREKVEEISLAWKEELENGNPGAVADLLREGGPVFQKVAWIEELIRTWKRRGDAEAQIRLRMVEEVISESDAFREKTLMLKGYDTYLEHYLRLQMKRERICGDCSRYQKDRYVVSCFDDCEFPDRFERLRGLVDDASRMHVSFRQPPHRIALRLTVIDGALYKRKHEMKK